MSLIILLIAILSIVVGLGVLWANPGRFLNWVFSLTSLLVSLWLCFVYKAFAAGEHNPIDTFAALAPCDAVLDRNTPLPLLLRATLTIDTFTLALLWN